MLRDLRAHIESLAVDDGTYTLVCGRHGDQPVPASGLWFPTRLVARQAARATTQYRAALRRYDPTLPRYDIVVCQGHPSTTEPVSKSTRRGTGSTHTAADSTAPADAEQSDRPLVTFCHRVAAAVFETLAADGYEDADTAFMAAYLAPAALQPTPYGLCLRLLERIATVLAYLPTPHHPAAV